MQNPNFMSVDRIQYPDIGTRRSSQTAAIGRNDNRLHLTGREWRK
jgi:hypothetical protein